nr:2A [Tortoise rafivirus A]
MKAVGKMGDFISQLEPNVLTEAFKNVGAVAKTFDDKMIADVVQTTKHGVGGIQ